MTMEENKIRKNLGSATTCSMTVIMHVLRCELQACIMRTVLAGFKGVREGETPKPKATPKNKPKPKAKRAPK